MRYSVNVEYMEPTYDQRVGRTRGPFAARYRVLAASREEAVEIGRREFEREASESSVHWTRQIVTCTASEDCGN